MNIGLCATLFLLIFSANAFARPSECETRRLRESSRSIGLEEFSQSFLWKVTRPGAEPNYLLGTFHSTDAGVLNRWEALIAHLSRAKILLTETEFSPESAREFGRRTLAEDERLRASIGRDLADEAARLLRERGLDEATIARMKPWAAFLLLAQPASASESLDAFLFRQAGAASVPRAGLQTPEEMAASAETLTASEQAGILADTVCNQDLIREQVDHLQKLYVAGDVPGFLAESSRLESVDPRLNLRLGEALAHGRNSVLSRRAQIHLDKGGALMLVGAAHLYGERGLLRRFRDAGYVLEPVAHEKFARELWGDVNSSTDDVSAELAQWLARNWSRSSGAEALAIRIVPTPELEARACGKPCRVSLHREGDTAYLSIEHFHELKRRSPRLMVDLLLQMIRKTHEEEAARSGDRTCVSWHRRNVESILLVSRYLSGRHLPVAGLEPLEVPNCTY